MPPSDSDRDVPVRFHGWGSSFEEAIPRDWVEANDYDLDPALDDPEVEKPQ